jgi:aspartyl-tRNA(Asn)/glutamyl-tRNA(Gln) amidotransferase subunit A
MNDDLEASPLDLPITALGAALRDRSLGVVDLVRASLDRIRATADLNAFIEVSEDEALAAATAHQTLLDQGYDLGPLHGIPIGVKDNIDRAGRRMTAGSRILADNVATTDATVVARLRRSGAVLVGTTNLHEFAWGGTTANPHYGACRNPWDTERIPAGSSGGSGVAVAVGATAASLGTDTGGSVRLPASMNGVTGIRPTIGRVSTAGVFPLAWTMDTVGPLARTSDDCALMLQEMAGWDPRDATTTDAHPGNYLGETDLPLTGLRVGIIDGYSLNGLQPGVEIAMRAAIATLETLGAIIVALNLPGIDDVVDAQIIVDAAEPSAVHQRWIAERPEDYGDDVRVLLQAGLTFSAVDYIQAQRYRAALRATFLERLRRVDVVVTPTIPFTAPRIGQHLVPIGEDVNADVLVGNMRYTALPSMTGTPAISLPVGFDDDGMPVGMQVIAAPFAEATLFRVGHHLQNATDFHQRRPAAAR